MKIGIIWGLWILTACTSGIEQESKVVLENDTSVVKLNMDGLWLESKGKYESSYVFIHDDTIYFLKARAEKYYISHDTLHLTSGGRFKRKIMELDSVHLIWKTNSDEIYTLYKKNLD